MKSLTSGFGTFETCRHGRHMSVVGGRAENMCSRRVFPSLTRSGLPTRVVDRSGKLEEPQCRI
jgi:hypothetical protein